MNKQERMFRFFNRMSEAGFSYSEAAALRRIEMTLHRWAEHECNGNIQRDETTNKPRWYYGFDGPGEIRSYPIADRETGALRRLAAIMDEHPAFTAYHQGDPRGCALYLCRKADLNPDLDIDAQYNRGIAVCV